MHRQQARGGHKRLQIPVDDDVRMRDGQLVAFGPAQAQEELPLVAVGQPSLIDKYDDYNKTELQMMLVQRDIDDDTMKDKVRVLQGKVYFLF